MTLKENRISFGITQKEAAATVGIPLRTYIRYENSPDENNIKYVKIKEILQDKYEISEDKGILSIEKIKSIIDKVFSNYEISFCYLFGSYAKGYASEKSDIDLLVDTTLTGLKYVGLVEQLHQELRKNVDVIRFSDLKDNIELINEIMKDGIKIYG